jgi:hypothetical protein
VDDRRDGAEGKSRKQTQKWTKTSENTFRQLNRFTVKNQHREVSFADQYPNPLGDPIRG